jgi:hypothetical protein
VLIAVTSLLFLDGYLRFVGTRVQPKLAASVGRAVPAEILREDLRRGESIVVVVFSESCSHCRQARYQWEKIVRSLSERKQRKIHFFSVNNLDLARRFLGSLASVPVQIETRGADLIEFLSVNQVPLYLKIGTDNKILAVGSSVREFEDMVHGNDF